MHESATDTDTDVAVRLRAATARLARRLRRETRAQATQSQLSALGAIDRLGPVTLGELAAFEQVTPPTMTRLVQGMEAAGWVARAADPAGVAMIGEVRSGRDAWIARRLAQLSPDDQAAVPRLVALLERLADCDQGAIPTVTPGGSHGGAHEETRP